MKKTTGGKFSTAGVDYAYSHCQRGLVYTVYYIVYNCSLDCL